MLSQGGKAFDSDHLEARDKVVLAYRMFLGRDPESDAVVDEISRRNLTDSKLGELFLSSKEFQTKDSRSLAQRKMNLPRLDPISVETSATADQLQLLFKHVETVWSRLGSVEPHWSVLTNPKFKAELIAGNVEEFYASGAENVQSLRRACERTGVELSTRTSCFELGCGVGRITLKLSELFEKVVGADISRSHLELAASELRKLGATNVELRLLKAISALDELPNFDLFYSMIVLQHNPPPVIGIILRKTLNKLKPGGIAYFQVPVYAIGYSFSIDKYLYSLNSEGGMEMHVFPQKQIFELFAELGCKVLEVREDGHVGNPNWISNTFLVCKESVKR